MSYDVYSTPYLYTVFYSSIYVCIIQCIHVHTPIRIRNNVCIASSYMHTLYIYNTSDPNTYIHTIHI